MALLNLQKISLSSKDREKAEQKRLLRKKHLLVLIHHYMEEFGFLQGADALKSELSFAVDEFVICDNINLEIILQDFESYYFLKYEKLPQIIKKIPKDKLWKHETGEIRNQRSKKQQKISVPFKQQARNVNEQVTAENWQFETYNFEKNARNNAQEIAEKTTTRVLEPLGSFESYDDEWKCMANIIMQDVGFQNNVHWNDVIGHNHAKELLKEAIVYPMKYHQLFSSLISPWKGILLYGPTGTGKTLLAAAAASDCQATFFKIGISTLLSKWRGESEKLMKVLFDLAKHHAPSIIFIDEIDALMSHRGCDHEASRRMKTEFFLHMDALNSYEKLVLVLAATNLPWELDYAILRRLEKRVFISPPNDEERMLLLKKFLPPSIEIAGHVKLKTSLDYNALTEATKNYAAADIEIACKEAKMNSVRQAFSALESESKMLIKSIALHPLNTSDVLQAINNTKPAASEFLQRYMEWKNEHGSE